MSTPAKPKRCWADESEDLNSPDLEPLPPPISLSTAANDFKLASTQKQNEADHKPAGQSSGGDDFAVDVWNLHTSVKPTAIERFFRNFGIEPVSSHRRGKSESSRAQADICVRVNLANEESFQKALKLGSVTLQKSIDEHRSVARIVKADVSGGLVNLPQEAFADVDKPTPQHGGGNKGKNNRGGWNDRSGDNYRDHNRDGGYGSYGRGRGGDHRDYDRDNYGGAGHDRNNDHGSNGGASNSYGNSSGSNKGQYGGSAGSGQRYGGGGGKYSSKDNRSADSGDTYGRGIDNRTGAGNDKDRGGVGSGEQNKRGFGDGRYGAKGDSKSGGGGQQYGRGANASNQAQDGDFKGGHQHADRKYSNQHDNAPRGGGGGKQREHQQNDAGNYYQPSTRSNAAGGGGSSSRMNTDRDKYYQDRPGDRYRGDASYDNVRGGNNAPPPQPPGPTGGREDQQLKTPLGGGGGAGPSASGGRKGKGANFDRENPQSPPDSVAASNVGSEAAPPETGGGYRRLQLKPRTKPVEKETREDPLAKFWDTDSKEKPSTDGGSKEGARTAKDGGSKDQPHEKPAGTDPKAAPSNATTSTAAETSVAVVGGGKLDKKSSSTTSTYSSFTGPAADQSSSQDTGGSGSRGNAKKNSRGKQNRDSKNQQWSGQWNGQSWDQGWDDKNWDEQAWNEQKSWKKQQQSQGHQAGQGGQEKEGSNSNANAWSKKVEKQSESPETARSLPEADYPSLVSRADADTSWRK